MEISEAIRLARGDRSREAFAGLIGCSLASVIRWESGRTRPTDYLHIDRLVGEGIALEVLVAGSSEGTAA